MIPQVLNVECKRFNETEKFYTVIGNFSIGVLIRLPILCSPRLSSPTKTGKFAWAWAVIMLAAPCAASAADSTQSDLEEVKRQIESVSTQLDEAENSHTAIKQHLMSNEIRFGELVEQMQDIDNRSAQLRREVDRLRAERSLTQTTLDSDWENVSSQVKVSYSIGRQDYLKLLLNQEDPSAILRTLTYHTIIQKSRNAKLRELHDEVRRISSEEDVIDQKIAILNELRKQKSATRIALDNSRRERESLLATVGFEIEDTEAQLERLRVDEEKLEKLLSGLKEDLTDISDTGEEDEPFANLKGALGWPARGKVLRRFGTERGANGLSWQGVLIGAKQGDTVHAVSHGRVAFAEPLKGFGLLLIIDHGDGYMSLYGRNGRLLKEVGDWVRTAEPVARVGQSSGDELTGLYFEIRHNGKPRNPVKWCRGASPLAADALVSG